MLCWDGRIIFAQRFKDFQIYGILIVMTKQQLIDTIAQSNNLSKQTAKLVIETVFDNIVEALSSGDKVEIRGFGSFKARKRDGRMGKNPKTGEVIVVPEKKVPIFKPGKELRMIVDGKDSIL